MSFIQEALDALGVYRRNQAHILGEDSIAVTAIDTCIRLVNEMSEIICCKDCKKHNKAFDEVHIIEDACPLILWRGKAQGHEFDYQYCVYAKRREE